MVKRPGGILLVIAVVALVSTAKASTFNYTDVYSEAKSNWNQSMMVYSDASGGSLATLNYSPTLPVGSFQAAGEAKSQFGLFGFSGSFQLSLPAGSNVALSTPHNGSWDNTPLAFTSGMIDQITVHGSAPYYDLAFQFYVDGSFTEWGTANCDIANNPLGLSGTFSTSVSLRNSSYRQSTDVSMTDAEYAPGLYQLTLYQVPTNVPLSMTFISGFSFRLWDEEQITTQASVDWLNSPGSVIVSNTLNDRADWYTLSGAADFGHTVSFGSFLALTNGVEQPDVTITSANGGTYTPAVPEPTSILLFSSGLAGIGLAAWRRKKA